MWLAYAFASAFFAGVTAILAKCGIRNINSNLVTAIRTVIVLIFAWIMVFMTGAQTGLSGISGKTLLFLVLSGFATGASWLCYFHALQLGDVNKVTPIDKSSTVLTILLAALFLNEEMNARKLIASVIIAAGTYLMIQKKKVENGNTDQRWLVYAGLSALFASLTSVLGKIGIQNIDANLGTAIRTGVVWIMAWIIVFLTGKQGEIRRIEKKSGLFICLSGITTGCSWLCYYRALQEGPASVVVPIDKLSILVTVLFSYVFLKEKMSKKSLAGLILIVSGTLLLL